MGEMVASVELENTTDRDTASEGLRDRSTIRRNMTRDKPRCAKRFEAAVHALFLSQNPQNLQ